MSQLFKVVDAGFGAKALDGATVILTEKGVSHSNGSGLGPTVKVVKGDGKNGVTKGKIWGLGYPFILEALPSVHTVDIPTEDVKSIIQALKGYKSALGWCDGEDDESQGKIDDLERILNGFTELIDYGGR